jgi:hypothetical protein
MYYVIDKHIEAAGKFIFFGEEPEGWRTKTWITGEKLPDPAPLLTLSAEDDRTSALSDLLLTQFNLLVCSPRLRGAFDAAGVNNIEYVPVKVEDRTTGATYEDYRIANVVGSIACLDVANSEVATFDSGKYRSVEAFSLLEDRIQPLPGMKSAPLIFRLAEFKYHVLAHESVKAACEKAKITGVKFIRTQDVG